MACRILMSEGARIGKRLAAIALIALLAACQPSGPEQSYNNYLSRLGRTLSVDVPEVQMTTLARPPRSAQLQLAIPPGNIDSLDFLAISGCAVQITIGKRNSSLGRMARPSQRLLLELEYLQLAPECISYQHSQGEAALAQTLQQAWDTKRKQLPDLIFNASLGGPEYRAFWRAPTPSVQYPANTGSAVPSALRAINDYAQRWLAGDYQADNQAVELLLAEIAAGDGGALLQALSVQMDWLRAADQIVAERVSAGPLCAPGFRPEASTILPNVIRKFFVGDIQPRAAALGRRYHELLPEIRALEELLERSIPKPYSDWQRPRDELLAAAAKAPRHHVKQLVAIQKPCGGMPR